MFLNAWSVESALKKIILALSPHLWLWSSRIDHFENLSCHILVVLLNFAQCSLPCAHLNPVALIPWAPSTAQNLKLPLIDELLKLMLLSLHQIFRPRRSGPYVPIVHTMVLDNVRTKFFSLVLFFFHTDDSKFVTETECKYISIGK